MIRVFWALCWFALGAISILTLLLLLGVIHPTVGIGSPGFLTN